MKIWNEIWDYIKMIIIVVVVVLVVNNVVLINAKIPSESMENTIMTGDRIFGFRMAYGLNFDLFGKHISYQTKDPEREIRDGKVYINGSDEPLDDSFVPEVPTGNYGPYTVPENSYFMLGDNREYSRDSRFWKNTFVSFDEIVGKAIVRYYPSIKLLK